MKKTILLIILVVLFLFGVSRIYMELKEYSDGEEEYTELEQFVSVPFEEDELVVVDNKEEIKMPSLAPEEVNVDFRSLKNINEDCVAWILIRGTNINYPVVKSADNNYYVSHTFSKKNNKSGTIFIDKRNLPDFSDKNTIIYGHNLKNSKMFSDLRKFLTKSYLDTHKRIIIYTEKNKLVYEVFSVYKTMEDSEAYKVKFIDQESFFSHIDMNIKKSQIEVTANKEDITNIITLSTCTNNKEGERIVVVAKLIEIIDMTDSLPIE